MDKKKKIDKRGFYTIIILSLIPILGVIFSFLIIRAGLFKYKKAWHVLIGLACMVFSVYSGVYLFNKLNHSKQVMNGFAEISKKQLNSLVTEIEFYKLQNGNYPDSLEQLQSLDKITVVIQDPLLVWEKPESQTKYNYQKMDGKYKLFSSGIDMMPNTSDDIYPDIKIDSNKGGYVR